MNWSTLDIMTKLFLIIGLFGIIFGILGSIASTVYLISRCQPKIFNIKITPSPSKGKLRINISVYQIDIFNPKEVVIDEFLLYFPTRYCSFIMQYPPWEVIDYGHTGEQTQPVRIPMFCKRTQFNINFYFVLKLSGPLKYFSYEDLTTGILDVSDPLADKRWRWPFAYDKWDSFFATTYHAEDIFMENYKKITTGILIKYHFPDDSLHFPLDMFPPPIVTVKKMHTISLNNLDNPPSFKSIFQDIMRIHFVKKNNIIN